MRKVMLLVATLVVLAGCTARTLPTEEAAAPAGDTVPAKFAEPQDRSGLGVHGHWCGIGVFGGPVVDDLDAICRQHDLCIDRRGALNCGCDFEMMRSIDAVSWSSALRPRANQIFEAIAALPCEGEDDETWGEKLRWAEGLRKAEVERGEEDVLEGFRRFLALMGIMLSSKKSN